MGKVRTITIDGIISSRSFYKSFYKHIESTAFSAKNKGRLESFWFGETHHSGEFEVGYHSFDFQLLFLNNLLNGMNMLQYESFLY